jgi:N-acetylglucosaminyl-diphospho-decaprenol L-rhamnosyltransferase
MSDETRWSPSLAVLVVNYGCHELVAENVNRSIDDDFAGHVVIVDNFTTRDERGAIMDLAVRMGWTCVTAETNLGFGGGMNLGVQAAIALGAQELLILNPDACLPPESIRLLHARVRADPMALVAPLIFRPDGRIFAEATDLYLDRGESLARAKRPSSSTHRIQPWVSGACFAISALLWERIGGFDDEYFLYWEDVDLCARASASGASIVVEERARAIHDAGATQRTRDGQRAKSPIYYYFNVRNRLLYAAKHLDRRDQKRWCRVTIGASYRILLRGGRRQFLHPTTSIIPALRGMWDGFRVLARSRRQGAR